MNTRQKLLDAVAQAGEQPSDVIVCFYKDQEGNSAYYDSEPKPIISCTLDELPTREFDNSWGGVEGEPIIAFSAKYVYVHGEYDGSEWVEAVPRHPEHVTFIPSIGGS